MKKVLISLFVISSFFGLPVFAQTPITIIDTSFKLAILAEEIYYFGFAEGDQLVFSFEEQNGKDLKEVEIVEWPALSRFKEVKASSIHKTLTIGSNSIYQFRFANSVLLYKICRLKIQRIPKEANRNFNSTVYWRTVYDTTYRTIQPATAAAPYKTVSLIPPTIYHLQANLPENNPRLSVPVTLPDFTSEWYYQYAVTTDKRKSETLKSSLQLAANLTQRISQAGGASFTADSLPVIAGTDSCRVYLLDQSNHQLFDSKQNFRHFREGTRENKNDGIVKIKIASFPNAFLGIRNHNPNAGIYVALEAVAIIEPEERGQSAETQSVSVKTKEEPYLKN